MRSLTILALAASLICSQAYADWDGQVSRDAMTDQKAAVLAGHFPEGDWPGIGFKCWEDGSLLFAILVSPFDDAAHYPNPATFELRIDHDPPETLTGIPANNGGFLNFQRYHGATKKMTPDIALLRRIGQAKERVVLSIDSHYYVTDMKGSAETVSQMIETCHLPGGPLTPPDPIPVAPDSAKRAAK